MEKIKNDVLDLLVPMDEFEPEGNLQLPTPSLLQYYLDRKARVVWIDKDIDSDLFNEIRQIIQYNREDEKIRFQLRKELPSVSLYRVMEEPSTVVSLCLML